MRTFAVFIGLFVIGFAVMAVATYPLYTLLGAAFTHLPFGEVAHRTSLFSALAAAGYHAFAPDQRGYGRTTGWDPDYDGDLASYRFTNLARDALGVVDALGHREVKAIVGHDFGASVTACAALMRPDIFRSMVLMSAPAGGPPPLRLHTGTHGCAQCQVRGTRRDA